MGNKNDKWSALSMSDRADLIKLYVSNGITSLDIIKKDYNSFGNGGPTGEGGYSTDSEEKRWDTFWSYDPAGGTGLSQLLYLSQGNQSRGEENEYWKAYLGLPNAVPEMNTNAKTSWDDAVEKEKITRGELPSDFYGTTPRMDLNIQAIADTLNTGKIVRNYKQYKKANPDLPPKMIIENMYEAGKQVLENPNTWQQVDGDITGIKRGLDPQTNEFSPLGMLANFGMMWSPEENALYMHDTYDFNKLGTKIVGKRPKEMKIRSKISFDPTKGSVLLRDDMANFNDYPEPLKK